MCHDIGIDVLRSRILIRKKGKFMLKRGLIAVSTLVFALSLAGCGEREQAKEDTEVTVSSTVEKPAGDASTAVEEKKPEAAAPAAEATVAPAPAPEAAKPEEAKPAEPAAPSAPAQPTN
jgi:type IV secretory pathway VirB10-like protein